MTSNNAVVTVLVVTYRGREFIADCLNSLAGQTIAHRVLIIDNCSTDGTAELLAGQFSELTTLRQPFNRGFAGAVALGLREVSTPWCALLNDDAVAEPSWLDALFRALAARPQAAAATSEMLLCDTDTGPGPGPGAVAIINNLGVALTPQGFGYDVGLGRSRDDGFAAVSPVFGFSGGAALLRVESLREVGGSPEHFFLYYEDTDMSWRLRLAGYEIVSVPGAVVHHRHSATIGQSSDLFHFHNERNRLLMLLRCAGLRFAIGQLLRFAVTTASLTVKRLLGQPVPAAANARTGLRLRVIGQVLGRLPAAMRQRREIGRFARISRADVDRRWLGFDPLASGR